MFLLVSSSEFSHFADPLVLCLQLFHDGNFPHWFGLHDINAHPPQWLCKICSGRRWPWDFGNYLLMFSSFYASYTSVYLLRNNLYAMILCLHYFGVCVSCWQVFNSCPNRKNPLCFESSLILNFLIGTGCKWRIWLETCPWRCVSASPEFGSTISCCWYWRAAVNTCSARHHFSNSWNAVHRVCQKHFVISSSSVEWNKQLHVSFWV